MHGVGQPGTLRRAANDAGIPAVLYEAGEPRRIDADEIARGVVAIRVLLESLEMLDGRTPRPAEQRLYGHTHWIRSDQPGMDGDAGPESADPVRAELLDERPE